MFHHLLQYDAILVTGPQRSGTTICARMIEADTGHEYLDEGLWKVWNGIKAYQIAKDRKPCVLQAPGLLKDVERFGQHSTVAVVLMRRNIQDIQRSQARIHWDMWARKEISNYLHGVPDHQQETYLKNAPMYVAQMKYAWFARYGRSKVKNLYTVEYNQLADHPLWVPKEKRTKFNARQYKL